MIDSEPMAIDSVRSGKNAKEIYGIDNFCFQNEGFGSLYAKARYESNDLVERARDKVRMLAE